jgi:hypothetical protein
MNISNLSPAEVLNYIPMPEQAYTAIETLIDDLVELEKEVESLQNSVSDVEDIYHDLEAILNHPANKGNVMLEALIDISNRLYSSI